MISTIQVNTHVKVMRTHIFIAVFVLHTAMLTFFMNIEPRSSEFQYTIGLMGLLLPIFTTWLTVSTPNTPTWFMLPRSFSMFLSACAVLILALTISLVFPMTLALVGDINIVHILGAYFGLLLLGVAYLSVGMCLRLWIGNGTMFGIVCFVLPLCLFFTVLDQRFGGFVKGLLSFSDIIFFVSFSAFFIATAMISIKGTIRNVIVPRALLVLVIFMLVNVLAGKSNLTFDLTTGRIYSLSSTTLKVLAELDEPVQIYAVFPPHRSEAHIEIAREILRQYSHHRNVHLSFTSPGRLLYEGFKDIALYSIVVIQHGTSKIIPPEKLFLTSFDEYELLINVTALNIEAELTSAILYCTARENHVVGQVLGNGEYTLPQAFTNALISANFNTVDVFITEDAIPPEVSILLITTPTNDWNTAETLRFSNFLDRGGSTVFALDATISPPQRLNSILADLGIELGDRLVIETQEYLYTGNNILATTLPFNAYGQVRRILMPSAQAIYLRDNYNTDVSINGIVTTSPYAFEQMNPWELTDEEPLGVFTLAAKVEAERKSTTTRAVVLGSSNIFDETANMFSGGENYRFLVDAINWTQHIEHTLDISPTPLNEYRLDISNVQALILMGLLGIAVPAIILLTGLRRQS